MHNISLWNVVVYKAAWNEKTQIKHKYLKLVIKYSTLLKACVQYEVQWISYRPWYTSWSLAALAHFLCPLRYSDISTPDRFHIHSAT